MDSADKQIIQTNLKLVTNIEFFDFVDLIDDSRNLRCYSGHEQAEKPEVNARIYLEDLAVINLDAAF